MKKHYCGQSPFGNGPAESCDIRDRAKRSADVKVIADYSCEWNAGKDTAECTQHGRVAPQIRSILARELRKLGMPAKPPGETYFTIWQANGVPWWLTEAYYSHQSGSTIEVCEVITVVDPTGHATLIRSLPLTKTDVDVPNVTQWDLMDIADTRGNGQADIILVGDAYENHWLEVISFHRGTAKTIFSGLGYYL